MEANNFRDWQANYAAHGVATLLRIGVRLGDTLSRVQANNRSKRICTQQIQLLDYVGGLFGMGALARSVQRAYHLMQAFRGRANCGA